MASSLTGVARCKAPASSSDGTVIFEPTIPSGLTHRCARWALMCSPYIPHPHRTPGLPRRGRSLARQHRISQIPPGSTLSPESASYTSSLHLHQSAMVSRPTDGAALRWRQSQSLPQQILLLLSAVTHLSFCLQTPLLGCFDYRMSRWPMTSKA